MQTTSGVEGDPSGGDTGGPMLSGPMAPGGMQVESAVPEKYSKPDTSGLTAEVKKGMEPVKLELTSQ